MGGLMDKLRNLFVVTDEYRVEENSMADSVTNITPVPGAPEGRYVATTPKKRAPRTEIVLIDAKNYQDDDVMVADIAQALEDGKSVIASVEDTQPNMRNRVIDFTSGMVHIIHGKTERIDRNIYLFANSNVTVSKVDVTAQAHGRDEREYGDFGNAIY